MLRSLAGLTCCLVTAVGAQAETIPVGVYNDVLLSTVTDDWGWTLIYRDDYSVDSIPIAHAFAGHGTYVMLGAIRDGSDTIDVLAAVAWEDFIIHTPRNVTKALNGAEWYYNGGSIGFAGLGDTIYQNQADYADALGYGTERDRLSWHASAGITIGAYERVPDAIRYGYRSGDNLGLNLRPDWDKLIFTLTPSLEPIPEPSTLALLTLGVVGLVVGRRRRDDSRHPLVD